MAFVCAGHRIGIAVFHVLQTTLGATWTGSRTDVFESFKQWRRVLFRHGVFAHGFSGLREGLGCPSKKSVRPMLRA